MQVHRWCDAHPAILFALLSGWYVGLVWKLAIRPLWFDELTTFYIARQPTVARMMEAIRTIDLNPPLNYFLTRWSMAVFGTSPWVPRLPGMIAFWLGSLAIFALLRRRTSSLMAALGVLLFWSSPFFPYATEARPYGLLLGFTAVLLAAWDGAAPRTRKWDIPLVFVAGSLLLLSHIFGTLSLGAVWMGEGVRAGSRRKIDRPMMAALVLPLIAALTYAPMLHSYSQSVFPPEAQVTWGKLWFLYYSVFRWMWRPLVAMAVVAFFWRKHRHAAGPASRMPGLATALLMLFLIPVAVTILFMRTHGAFFDRYAMAVVIPIVLLAPMLLRKWTNANPSATLASLSAVAFLLLLSTALRVPLVRAASAVLPAGAASKASGILTTSVHGPFRAWWTPLPVPATLLQERKTAPLLASLDNFDPDLPLVAADELTFVEMDHRASSAVTGRLYYLYDREAEVTIAHRSASGTMMQLEKFFPLRGKVEPYRAFIAQHRQFLVIGRYEHSGDWLLRQLEIDGAGLQVVAQIEGYSDTDLYLVTLAQK